jgi:PAS domain S-box-containing protein
MSHILSALLYAVLDLWASPKPHSSTYESYVQDSIDYMNRHIYDKITVNDISEALGVCGYHYIRLFKSVTGVTPMNYFLKLKTAKGAELLKSTGLPIADIAEKLHFSSDAHFSRTFKRHMCDTPSVYRRQAALVTDKYTFNDMLLQTIIDSSPDLIFFKDKNFMLLGCNKAFCQVLGLDKAQIIGKRDVDLFPYEEALFYNHIDEAILVSGEPQSNGEWMTLPDGTKKRFEVMKAPFYDETGSVAGIVGISREMAAAKGRRGSNQKI